MSYKSESQQRVQVTDTFRETHEQVFGEKPRSNRRTRFVYTMGGEPLPEPIEVGEDWENVLPRAQTTTEELVHGNARTTDGIDISSRKKRREYMKMTGVADLSDFNNHLAKSEERKAAENRGEFNPRELREITDTVGRAAYELRSKRRR